MGVPPLLDRVSVIHTDSSTVSYVRLEGDGEFNVVHAPVQRFTQTHVVSEDMLNDLPAMKVYESRIRQLFDRAVDDYLLQELIDVATVYKARPFHRTTREILETVYEFQKNVGFVPDIVALTPYRYSKLMNERSGDVQPFWGVPVVTYPDLEPGHVFIGAAARGAGLVVRGEPNLETSNSNEDFFRRGLVALRAEQPIAVLVYDPNSFIDLQLRAWPEKFWVWRRNLKIRIRTSARRVWRWLKR